MLPHAPGLPEMAALVRGEHQEPGAKREADERHEGIEEARAIEIEVGHLGSAADIDTKDDLEALAP